MVLHALQPSLNGGELAPSLRHRPDLQKFSTCVKLAENFFAKPEGGLSNRAGLEMMAKAKAGQVRLITFEFDNDNTYILEVGPQYIRFYTPNGQIVNEEGEPYEISSPFEANDIWKIRARQLADVMYIAWGGKPKTLTRYGHTDWRLEDYDYKNGPFEPINYSNKEPLSVVYDKDIFKYKFTSVSDLFLASDVGRLIRIEKEIRNSHIAGTINTSSGNYTSEIYLGSGNYFLRTSNTWDGLLTVERSSNKVDWEQVRSFSSNNNNNYDFTGNLGDNPVWFRIVGKINAGTVNFTLDTQSQKKFFVFLITHFTSTHQVEGDSKNDITGLEDYFIREEQGNVGEIIDLIPHMTSNTTPSGTAYSDYLGNNAYKVFSYDSLPDGYPSGESTGMWIPVSTEFSVGYKPGFSFYLNSITFNISAKNAESFDSVFTKLEIYGRLDNGALQKLDYSVSSFNLSSTSRKRATLNLSGNFLMNDLFIKIIFGNTTDSYKKRSIYNLKARGFKYVENNEDTRENIVLNYSKGLWSNASAFPSNCVLYQDRIGWTIKQRMDFTKISAYNDFGVSDPVADDDAISVTLVDQKINQITAVAVSGKLVAFTSSGNHTHNQTTMTPSTATFDKDSDDGAGFVDPAVARGSILYASPTRSAISDYQYDYQVDGYRGNDITLMAAHLFKNQKIKEMVFQAEPDNLLWVVLESGELLCCTYLKQENVLAWTHMKTAGKVLSAAVLYDGNYQNLYLAVERATGTFVEKMPVRLLSYDPKEQFFVDCGRTYRGAPATIITGLNYLEGQEVAILADGQVQPRKTVQNGQVELDYPASVVHIGLPYEATVVSLSTDISMDDGSMLDRKKRIVGATVFFTDTVGGLVGTDGFGLDPVDRPRAAKFNEPVPLRDFAQNMTLASIHEQAPSLVVKQEDPLPMTITGWVLKVAVGG